MVYTKRRSFRNTFKQPFSYFWSCSKRPFLILSTLLFVMRQLPFPYLLCLILARTRYRITLGIKSSSNISSIKQFNLLRILLLGFHIEPFLFSEMRSFWSSWIRLIFLYHFVNSRESSSILGNWIWELWDRGFKSLFFLIDPFFQPSFLLFPSLCFSFFLDLKVLESRMSMVFVTFPQLLFLFSG